MSSKNSPCPDPQNGLDQLKDNAHTEDVENREDHPA